MRVMSHSVMCVMFLGFTVKKVLVLLLFFFFSSRRRHTRCSRDWSSDVCSSDLRIVGTAAPAGAAGGRVRKADTRRRSPTPAGSRWPRMGDAQLLEGIGRGALQ